MKTVRVVCIALFCCLLAPARFTYAQSTTQTPAETYNHLMNMLEKEIVDAADAMPADKYNFAPTQGNFTGVRTFAQQIKHLTEANYNFYQGWGVPGAVKRADIEKLTTKDEIVKALRDSYAYAHKAIDTITPENAFTISASGEGGGKMTRAGVASFNLAHSMDHYGQMVEYLRMNGIIPPASRK